MFIGVSDSWIRYSCHYKMQHSFCILACIFNNLLEYEKVRKMSQQKQRRISGPELGIYSCPCKELTESADFFCAWTGKETVAPSSWPRFLTQMTLQQLSFDKRVVLFFVRRRRPQSYLAGGAREALQLLGWLGIVRVTGPVLLFINSPVKVLISSSVAEQKTTFTERTYADSVILAIVDLKEGFWEWNVHYLYLIGCQASIADEAENNAYKLRSRLARAGSDVGRNNQIIVNKL